METSLLGGQTLSILTYYR